MNTVVLSLRLVGGLVLLLLNGFFVTTEFAMTRVPQFPAEEFQGHRGLERAWEMTDRLEIYLSGCQVGITIASISLGVVAEPAVSAVVEAGLRAAGYAAAGGGHAGLSVVLSLVLINGLHVIVAEQAPTYLGVERTKTVAKYLAPALYWWTHLMGPFIRFADGVAKWLLGLAGVTITRSWQEVEEEELSFADVRSQMGETLAKAGLPAELREEVLNTLETSRTPVSEILIPRDEMVVLTEGDPEANLRRIRENPQHSRFPLFAGNQGEAGGDHDGEAGDLVGIVYVTTVLANVDALRAGDRTFADVAAPPMTLAADTTVSEAIDRFQAENQELAVVVEAGRVVGLLTASDAFEAIAGELEDPLDLGPDRPKGTSRER